MALTNKQFTEMREALDAAQKPFFLHDDDPDGTCAYLLLCRYRGEGKGMPVKSIPVVDAKFITHIQRYEPDLLFILDMPLVDQEFLDAMTCPVIWLDHHPVQDRKKVRYYNPRTTDPEDNPSTTVNAYHVVQQDLWLAMVGGVADWQLPDFTDEFRKKYPDLLAEDIKTPEDALFTTPVGILVKVVSFLLKGDMADVKKSINVLAKIKSPYEILKQETPQGKYLWKVYERINKPYEKLLAQALKQPSKDGIKIFTYPDTKMSFTKELSNEMLYRFPDDIVVIGRIKNGEYKLSLRSKHIKISDALEKALVGISGYGGGHEHACGACVKVADFEQFTENLHREVAALNS